MTNAEDEFSTVSDLYKSVYGFRPTSCFWEQWNTFNYIEKKVVFDGLVKELEISIEMEKEIETRTIEYFEDKIEETIKHGAKDRETAIRWIIDGFVSDMSDTDAEYVKSDIGYLCYYMGIPYSYESEFAKIIKKE